MRKGVALKSRVQGVTEAAEERDAALSAVALCALEVQRHPPLPMETASALTHGAAAGQAMRLSRELAAVQAGAEARAEAAEERIAALQAAVERLTAEAGAAADLAATREQARLPLGWV